MIGQILIEQGHITLVQLNEARRKQMFDPLKRPLGEILCALGYLSSVQVEEALKQQEQGETHG